MNRRPLCIELADKVKNTESNGDSKIFSKMFYDPIAGINKINIGNKSIPAVFYNEQFGTATFTKAKGEITDPDAESMNSIALETMTHTEAQAESTDRDPSSIMHFGTKTFTAVMSEQTDSD